MLRHILEFKPTGEDKNYIPGKRVSAKCCKYSGLLDCKVEPSCQFQWLRHYTKNVNNRYCHILGKHDIETDILLVSILRYDLTSLRDCHNLALFFVNWELTLLSKTKPNSFIWKGRNRVVNARFHHLCYIRKDSSQNVVVVSNLQLTLLLSNCKFGRKHHWKDHCIFHYGGNCSV